MPLGNHALGRAALALLGTWLLIAPALADPEPADPEPSQSTAASPPAQSKVPMEWGPAARDSIRMVMVGPQENTSAADSSALATQPSSASPADRSSAAGAGGSDLSGIVRPGQPSPNGGGTLTHPQDAEPGLFSEVARLPRITAVGAYGGYPSVAGLQIAVPADGTLAFRSGLTGFPGIGYLFTPGVEIRFGQVPGTYSTNSGYTFANLFLGRENKAGQDKTHKGLEAGLGYRWILPDRRAVRWIGAIEAGAKWTPDSQWPDLPTIRAYWMIASP
jgi:hypothetical protein